MGLMVVVVVLVLIDCGMDLFWILFLFGVYFLMIMIMEFLFGGLVDVIGCKFVFLVVVVVSFVFFVFFFVIEVFFGFVLLFVFIGFGCVLWFGILDVWFVEMFKIVVFNVDV